MKPQRPYLLRALYEWIVDNDETPYVLVKVDNAEVCVPLEHVKDDQIVLNISPSAVRNLVIGDEYVMCSGRFSGREFELVLPLPSVAAIYCKDSGAGMVFPEEETYAATSLQEAGNPEPVSKSGSSNPEDDPTPPESSEKPTLRLV